MKKFKEADKTHALIVKQECTRLWNASSVDGSLSAPFFIKELFFATKQIKTGKAQGPKKIPPEFQKH